MRDEKGYGLAMSHPSFAREADCLFCKMVAGEIPVQKVAEGDHWFAFSDISPQAPTHILVIPKAHTASFAEASAELLSHAFQGAQAVARELDLTDYRLITNVGAGAGQSVFHLHVHVLAGRPFTWPPG